LATSQPYVLYMLIRNCCWSPTIDPGRQRRTQAIASSGRNPA
jgi:hypothetical protein